MEKNLQSFNINSEKIEQIAFDGNTLQVKEHNGTITAYMFVEAQMVNNFLSSLDKDQFFQTNIENNRQYRKRVMMRGR